MLGMPALVEYTSLNQLLELCMKLKLSFIELNMNLPYNFIQKLPPNELKKITRDTNIKFTMHMPDEADIGSLYESVRAGYEQLFSDTIEWAKEAGVQLLNMHIIEGSKMTLPDKKIYIYDKYSEEFTNNFIKSIKTLSNKAQKNNIILAIENSSNFGNKYIQDALDIALTYPKIKLTWDTGHDAVSNFKDKIYLMKNREHIAHMHLHDAKGSHDHQVLFEGELNIKELLNFAQSVNIKTLIEVKTEEALIKSIDNLNNNLSKN
ncbi:MAG: sugar phosphate isomerase/epimerase family protein, partial [Sedimentibacter sp.]